MFRNRPVHPTLIQGIGVDNCQYFPGRSCCDNPDYDFVFVGANSSENEALNDALESAVESEAITSDQAKEIEESIKKAQQDNGVDMDLTVEKYMDEYDPEQGNVPTISGVERCLDDLYFYVALYL